MFDFLIMNYNPFILPCSLYISESTSPIHLAELVRLHSVKPFSTLAGHNHISSQPCLHTTQELPRASLPPAQTGMALQQALHLYVKVSWSQQAIQVKAGQTFPPHHLPYALASPKRKPVKSYRLGYPPHVKCRAKKLCWSLAASPK